MLNNEQEYRQLELDKLVNKYRTRYYQDYYVNEMRTLVVFIRKEIGLTVRNCKNIQGLTFCLPFKYPRNVKILAMSKN
jgi:hypothetical protein